MKGRLEPRFDVFDMVCIFCYVLVHCDLALQVGVACQIFIESHSPRLWCLHGVCAWGLDAVLGEANVGES